MSRPVGKRFRAFAFWTLLTAFSAPLLLALLLRKISPLVNEAPYPEPISIEHHHPSRTVDTDALDALIRRVVDAEGGALRHVGVVLAGHDTVRRLNREYLDHDYDTDVLAFSLAEPDVATGPDVPAQPDESGAEDGADDEHPVVEGEVYVDLDTAAERHDEFDATFEEEVQRYVVHGVLHLIGYDDHTERGNAEMRDLEDRYLGDE